MTIFNSSPMDVWLTGLSFLSKNMSVADTGLGVPAGRTPSNETTTNASRRPFCGKWMNIGHILLIHVTHCTTIAADSRWRKRHHNLFCVFDRPITSGKTVLGVDGASIRFLGVDDKSNTFACAQSHTSKL
uniref:Uncharacterized protein n=1 Tax=Romanomermis culicivorax TaxID=13658 RepID=A0A915JJT8_ROMCU